ncbi:MAG: VWA domain-containing protein [Myxococcales bacterium]|nr:VWA domain-containing protein [Myxococcales bacterium]
MRSSSHKLVWNHRSARCGALALAVAALACTVGGREPTETDAASAPMNSGSGIASLGSSAGTSTSGGETTGATVGGGAGAPCGEGDACPNGQVCAPASDVCLPPGACLINLDCEDGMVCEEGSCSIGGECGADEFMLTKLAPNLMIVLDRSGSMESEIQGLTRWQVAKDAITAVTNGFDAEIRFGLDTYSSCLPGGCSAGSIVVPIADANAAAINGFLADKVGAGSSDGMGGTNGGVAYLCDSGDPETSTGKSLHTLVGEPTLQDPARGNAVLLITDGEESGACANPDGPTGAAALLAQARPVKTYVVGFSQDVDAGELNAVAQAGGTQQYYPADDLQQLEQALQQIAEDVASCEYLLDDVPPNPDDVHVFFNDDPAGVARDPVNGWDYDPETNKVTFYGEACALIQNGQVEDIDIVFGCELPIPG